MNESKGGELRLRQQKRRQSRRLLVTQSATTLTKEMRKPHSKWPFLQHSLTHCSHLSVWTSAAYKYMNLSKWHTNDYICADCSLAYVGYFWTLSFLNCAFYHFYPPLIYLGRNSFSPLKMALAFAFLSSQVSARNIPPAAWGQHLVFSVQTFPNPLALVRTGSVGTVPTWGRRKPVHCQGSWS